jgi:hypothetical protein
LNRSSGWTRRRSRATRLPSMFSGTPRPRSAEVLGQFERSPTRNCRAQMQPLMTRIAMASWAHCRDDYAELAIARSLTPLPRVRPGARRLWRDGRHGRLQRVMNSVQCRLHGGMNVLIPRRCIRSRSRRHIANRAGLGLGPPSRSFLVIVGPHQNGRDIELKTALSVARRLASAVLVELIRSNNTHTRYGTVRFLLDATANNECLGGLFAGGWSLSKVVWELKGGRDALQALKRPCVAAAAGFSYGRRGEQWPVHPC